MIKVVADSPNEVAPSMCTDKTSGGVPPQTVGSSPLGNRGVDQPETGGAPLAATTPARGPEEAGTYDHGVLCHCPTCIAQTRTLWNHQRAREDAEQTAALFSMWSNRYSSEAGMRCEHQWQHRCGKCGEPSEIDGCTETERSQALAALRKISSLVTDDSPIDQIAQETIACLLHEQYQETIACLLHKQQCPNETSLPEPELIGNARASASRLVHHTRRPWFPPDPAWPSIDDDVGVVADALDELERRIRAERSSATRSSEALMPLWVDHAKQCGHSDPDNRHLCTIERGHVGAHVTVDPMFGSAIAAWPCTNDARPDPTTPHLVAGEFQSDKYPTTPRGKVPLSTKDPMAQDLLWEYAQRRRAVDVEFAADLETALRLKGFISRTDKIPTALDERRLVTAWLRGFGPHQPAFSGDELAMRIECCKHHTSHPSEASNPGYCPGSEGREPSKASLAEAVSNLHPATPKQALDGLFNAAVGGIGGTKAAALFDIASAALHFTEMRQCRDKARPAVWFVRSFGREWPEYEGQECFFTEEKAVKYQSYLDSKHLDDPAHYVQKWSPW